MIAARGGSDEDEAARYRTWREGRAGRRRTDELFATAIAPLPAVGRAVDAGGGDGEMALRLARRGQEVVLLDESAAMLALAAQARRAEDVEVAARLHLVRGDVRRPPLADASAHTVLCCFVLEYLPAPEEALASLASLVARGGHLALASLAQGAEGDGQLDAVFGRVRRGLSIASVRAALPGFEVLAASTVERYLHLVARR